MRKTIRLFKMGMRQITRDGMLFALLPAPFLLGLFVRFGVPFVDSLLQRELSFSIQPWYSLADAMLLAMTPLLLGMSSAFVLLDEKDEGTGLYYQITPVEGYAYLGARIGIPMIWSFLCSIFVTMVFGISDAPFARVAAAALISSLLGLSVSMMVVSFAGNKVEGLAISKLSGIILIGLAAVWFVPAPYRYLASFLPSYWLGDLVQNGVGLLPVLGGLLTGILWIGVFTRVFLRKI